MTRPAPQVVALLGSFAPSLINFRGPLIEAMVGRGHRVHALAPDIDGPTAAQLRSIGAEPRSVELARTSLNPLRTLASQRSLSRLFRELRPDLVIAYTIKPVVLGAAAARAAGVERFVPMVTGLGYAFTGGFEPKRILSRVAASLMYRRAFARSTVALFQNPDDLADFRRLRLLPAALPTALINGSGVDTRRFAEVPVPEGPPSFLMIGRLLGDKGVREYGSAAARLKREHPEVRVSLAGWIDPSPDAIGQAELDSLVASGIDYLGRLDDVRPAIAAHSVYVLPSYREGTPRSVLEAMATGRAIVTSDAPGCRQTVIEGENGLLAPPRDSDALYRAMLRFVEEPDLAFRLGPRSRRIAEQRFDVDAVNSEILRLAGL
ncbi:MAG TPA: glycosyltransferase family 4 protein [Allosphingosinicella sp.]